MITFCFFIYAHKSEVKKKEESKKENNKLIAAMKY